MVFFLCNPFLFPSIKLKEKTIPLQGQFILLVRTITSHYAVHRYYERNFTDIC